MFVDGKGTGNNSDKDISLTIRGHNHIKNKSLPIIALTRKSSLL